LITKLFPYVIAEETERLRAELTQVRTELEPWEKQIIEHKGKLDVASAEKELMTQKVAFLSPNFH
jgi:chromosome segregation ATPase